MLKPRVGDRCLVVIMHGGGSAENPPDLLPPVPCKVVYIDRAGARITRYTVRLLEDAEQYTGWFKGDSYRATEHFLHQLPAGDPADAPHESNVKTSQG
jgi:hypothetical protein